MTTQRELQTQPSAIIDRQIVSRRRRPTNEVLIQWANLPKEDATWKNYDDLKIKFPEFMNHQPRGQGGFEEGGSVRTLAWRVLIERDIHVKMLGL